MHRKLKQIAGIGLICACFSVGAQEANYLGLMYKYRHMPGRSATAYSTQAVLPKSYNGGELFFEHRCESDVGFHIGYEQSQNKTIRHAFSANQLFIGPPQAAGDISVISTRIRALQFDMTGYMAETKNLELVGHFGFSMMQADMQASVYSAGIAHNVAPGKGAKPIPRFGFGMQYKLGPSKFALRLAANWEGTNLYKMHMIDDDGVRHYIRPFKPSWCVVAGLVVTI